MLNLYGHLISNNLNNTVFEEIPDDWKDRLSPGKERQLITGFYNAGVLRVNLNSFNKGGFYDQVIKKELPLFADALYGSLAPIIQTSMRRMFYGFNTSLQEYKVVLIIEAPEEEHTDPFKYNITIF